MRALARPPSRTGGAYPEYAQDEALVGFGSSFLEYEGRTVAHKYTGFLGEGLVVTSRCSFTAF